MNGNLNIKMSSNEDSNYDTLEIGTPDSSPPQLVPENRPHQIIDNKPYLRILVEPQSHFRFRYESEFGTHGCLQGRTKGPDTTKTYPTVELRNYSGRAIIKCAMYQSDKKAEHPHRFHVEEEERAPSVRVPDGKSYKVCFPGLGVVIMTRKNQFRKSNKKKLRDDCDELGSSINLHEIRLRFSAHNVDTDKEICEPVFSEPIKDASECDRYLFTKDTTGVDIRYEESPKSNMLNICYSSHSSGKPCGGDILVLLVEKIKASETEVIFYENNSDGDRIWEKSVKTTDSTVHHQYAIKLRIPAYKDAAITKDVQVFMELYRPFDRERSPPIGFTYIPDKNLRYKRKRPNPSFSLQDSLAGSDIPTKNVITEKKDVSTRTSTPDTSQFDLKTVLSENNIHIPEGYNCSGLDYDSKFETEWRDIAYNGEIVENYYVVPPTDIIIDHVVESRHPESNLINNPVLSQANVPAPIRLCAIKAEKTCAVDVVDDIGPQEEIMAFNQESIWQDPDYMDMFKFTDSGRPFHNKNTTKKSQQKTKTDEVYFKAEEGHEVQKLVKEICELKKDKSKNHTQELKMKLKRLFEIRLSNGDTFLHMTLISHLTSFEFMVNIVDSVGMNHLLDEVNYEHQTVLHLAVLYDMSKTVAYLIEKGCDPMKPDLDGNTVIHLAVICNSSLDALLGAMKKKNGEYDMDKVNQTGQTPLHLAAVYESSQSARLLLSGGCSRRLPQDCHGRSALHIAVENQHLDLVQTLLQFISPREVNMTEWQCMTALQVAVAAGAGAGAGDERSPAVEICRLLLEHGADPLRHENGTKPAWKLARGNAQMWEIMKPYIPEHASDESSDDSSQSGDSSESDDEFQSADDGESEDAEYITNKLKSVELDEETNND